MFPPIDFRAALSSNKPNKRLVLSDSIIFRGPRSFDIFSPKKLEKRATFGNSGEVCHNISGQSFHVGFYSVSFLHMLKEALF